MYILLTSWYLSISFAISKDVSCLSTPPIRVTFTFTADLIWDTAFCETEPSSPIIITSLGFRRFNSAFVLSGISSLFASNIGASYVDASGVAVIPSAANSPLTITTLLDPSFQPCLLISTAVSNLVAPASFLLAQKFFSYIHLLLLLNLHHLL